MTALVAGVLVGGGAWWFVAGRAASRPTPRLPRHRGRGAPVPGPREQPRQLRTSATGMTEGLIADLAQIGSLKVISRSSGAVAQGTARSLAELARELGVEAVVKGSIRRAGDTVRVNVRFLHAPDSTAALRAETISVVSASCRTCSGRSPSPSPARSAPSSRAPSGAVSTCAGRWISGPTRPTCAAASTWSATSSSRRGRSSSRRAAIAPDWAPPYVGLANYYTSLPFSTDVPPAEVLPKARAALAQALELDETLAEAHAANAYIRAYYEWDWRARRAGVQARPRAAAQLRRRVLLLQPLSRVASPARRGHRAARTGRRAGPAVALRCRRTGPCSTTSRAATTRRTAGCARSSSATPPTCWPSGDWRWWPSNRGDSTTRSRSWSRSAAAASTASRRSAMPTRSPGRPPRRGTILGDAPRAEAEQRYVPSYWFALVHAGLGERDQALRYLERAYEERSTVLAYLLIDPRLAPLRDDPRFIALVHRLGGD